MLEEGPGQPDQHDLAEDIGDLVKGADLRARVVPHAGDERRIGIGPRGERAEPPEEHQPADDRETVTTDAVKDGDRHCRGPFIHL